MHNRHETYGDSVLKQQQIIITLHTLNSIYTNVTQISKTSLQLTTNLLLDSNFQFLATGHGHHATTTASGFNLHDNLLHGLIKVTFRIVRQTQGRRTHGLLADGPHHMRSVPTLQIRDQSGPNRGEGGEDDKRGHSPDDAVEVDTRPDSHGVFEAKEDEGHHSETKGELGGSPTGNVVVALARHGLGAVGGQEEGADVATEV